MKFIATVLAAGTMFYASIGSHLGSVGASAADQHKAKIERAING